MHAQHLGRYFEGQGHIMTLKQNHVRLITLILQLFHKHDHHIEMTCREQHLGRYLEGQGHSMPM